MKPAHYSFHRARHQKIGWRREGRDISYYPNRYPVAVRRNAKSPDHYFTLTFKMTFVHKGDTHLIACMQPYSYTRLQRFLGAAASKPGAEKVVRRTLLCNTLGGLRCDLLTITDFTASDEEMAERKAVVFTGRVHPGGRMLAG